MKDKKEDEVRFGETNQDLHVVRAGGDYREDDLDTT